MAFGGGLAMRMVVVEDDGRIASFVSRGLASQQHQVEIATDGVEGIALAADPGVGAW